MARNNPFYKDGIIDIGYSYSYSSSGTSFLKDPKDIWRQGMHPGSMADLNDKLAKRMAEGREAAAAKRAERGGLSLRERYLQQARIDASNTVDDFSSMLGVPGNQFRRPYETYTPRTASAAGRAKIRAEARARRLANMTPKSVSGAASSSTVASAAAEASAAKKSNRGFGLLYKVAKAQYRGANALSKALFGASIPQIGLIGGGIGLAAYAGLGLLGINAGTAAAGAAGTAVGLYEGYEAARIKSRSLMDFQQSAQGLTFGLHNRRTA